MRGRAIKGNKGTETPQNLIVFDTESRCEKEPGIGVQKHTLMLGTAIGWRREKGRVRSRDSIRFNESGQLWQWVERRMSPYRTTWIWCHNLGFDLSIVRFWELWENGTYVDRFHVLDGIPTILCGKLFGCSVVLCDTLNWWRRSLREIGQWLGLPKLDMPGDSASSDDWCTYCMRDSEITELLVNRTIDIVEELDLGCLRYTAPSQAFRCWQHRFRCDGVVPPTNISETKLAREAYYGGRCDLWYRGRVSTPLITPASDQAVHNPGMPDLRQGPVQVLDVTSMYGSIMRDNKLPCRLADYTKCCSVSDIQRNHGRYGMIARVSVNTAHALPVRMPELGTVWAVGKFETVLSGNELTKAWLDGSIKAVHEIATYDMDWVCRDYATYWLGKREEWRKSGDSIMEEFAKLMNNSLYGKWGQQSPQWQRDDSFEPDFMWGSGVIKDADTGQVRRFRATAGVVDVEVSRGETEHSFAAIAGYITSLARQLMDKYRTTAGHGQVYYQCIDSIHTTKAGLRRLIENECVADNTPGKLRLTKEIYDASYWGINVWAGDGELKASGLPKSAKQAGSGCWDYLSFEQLASLLARQPDGSVIVREERWRPDWKYRHGSVGPTGWVSPLVLPIQQPE